MSKKNGNTPDPPSSGRPAGEARSPFDIPFRWLKMAPDDVFKSRDGIIQVRVVAEPEKEVRLVVDGGTFTRRQSAKAIGDFLMSVLTGPDQNARSFRGFDTDLLITMLDNWHLIDKPALRKFITDMVGPLIHASPVDVTDELEEIDE